MQSPSAVKTCVIPTFFANRPVAMCTPRIGPPRVTGGRGGLAVERARFYPPRRGLSSEAPGSTGETGGRRQPTSALFGPFVRRLRERQLQRAPADLEPPAHPHGGPPRGRERERPPPRVRSRPLERVLERPRVRSGPADDELHFAVGGTSRDPNRGCPLARRIEQCVDHPT